MSALLSHCYIVDDDPLFGKTLTRLLKSKGFFADYFLSGRSFLESVSPDLHGYAIIDIQMPDMGGFHLIDKMKVLHYDMPVIVITGQFLSDDRDTAMQKGAVGFLHKPFTFESLQELLEAEGKIMGRDMSGRRKH